MPRGGKEKLVKFSMFKGQVCNGTVPKNTT